MANELVHGTVGVSMTQAEFEAVGLHVLNSQATGDVIYASSATQLTRLGIGATNAILTVIGGVPTWQTSLSGLTFVAPALGAATATSINGLVITTTAGTLTIANSASAALVTSGNYSITLTATAATNVTLPTTGTLATLAGTEELDSKTLDSSVGKGTWTASGTWTIPAVTLGGTVTLSSQTFSGNMLLGSGAAALGSPLTDAGTNVLNVYRVTTDTDSIQAIGEIEARSSGDMADGFGAGFEFYAGDAAAPTNWYGLVGAVRAGADNKSNLVFYRNSGGAASQVAIFGDAINFANPIQVSSTQVVTTRQAAVADVSDGLLATTITQLNALLARIRTHGLIAT